MIGIFYLCAFLFVKALLCNSKRRFVFLTFFLGTSLLCSQDTSFRGTVLVKSYDMNNDYNNSVVAQVKAKYSDESLANFDTIYREYYVCNDTLIEKLSGVNRLNYELGIQYGDYSLVYIKQDYRYVKLKNNRASNFFLSKDKFGWTKYEVHLSNNGKKYNYSHVRKGDNKFKIFADVDSGKTYRNIQYAGVFANVFHVDGLYRHMVMYDGRTAIYREYAYNSSENCDCSKFFDGIVVKDLTNETLSFLNQDSIVRPRENKSETPIIFGEIVGVDGEKIMLDSIMAPVPTYIDVWASWCGPCIAEMPYTKKIRKIYGPDKLNIVLISLDTNRDKWVKKIVDKDVGDWINCQAKEGFDSDFAKRYDIRAIPRYILVDANGVIIDDNAPAPSSDELINLLSEVIDGKD